MLSQHVKEGHFSPIRCLVKKVSPRTQRALNSVPKEVFSHILTFLGANSLEAASLVSPVWCQEIKNAHELCPAYLFKRSGLRWMQYSDPVYRTEYLRSIQSLELHQDNLYGEAANILNGNSIGATSLELTIGACGFGLLPFCLDLASFPDLQELTIILPKQKFNEDMHEWYGSSFKNKRNLARVNYVFSGIKYAEYLFLGPKILMNTFSTPKMTFFIPVDFIVTSTDRFLSFFTKANKETFPFLQEINLVFLKAVGETGSVKESLTKLESARLQALRSITNLVSVRFWLSSDCQPLLHKQCTFPVWPKSIPRVKKKSNKNLSEMYFPRSLRLQEWNRDKKKRTPLNMELYQDEALQLKRVNVFIRLKKIFPLRSLVISNYEKEHHFSSQGKYGGVLWMSYMFSNIATNFVWRKNYRGSKEVCQKTRTLFVGNDFFFDQSIQSSPQKQPAVIPTKPQPINLYSFSIIALDLPFLEHLVANLNPPHHDDSIRFFEMSLSARQGPPLRSVQVNLLGDWTMQEVEGLLAFFFKRKDILSVQELSVFAQFIPTDNHKPPICRGKIKNNAPKSFASNICFPRRLTRFLKKYGPKDCEFKNCQPEKIPCEVSGESSVEFFYTASFVSLEKERLIESSLRVLSCETLKSRVKANVSLDSSQKKRAASLSKAKLLLFFGGLPISILHELSSVRSTKRRKFNNKPLAKTD